MKHLFISLTFIVALVVILPLSGQSGMVVNPQDQDNGLICGTCRTLVNTIKAILLNSKFIGLWVAIIKPICKIIVQDSFCESVNSLGIPYYTGAVERLFNSEVICSKIKFCKEPKIVKDTDEAYKKRILNQTQEIAKSKVLNQSQDDVYKFVIFNDVHMDLEYEEGKKTECHIPLCCRIDTAKAKNNDSSGHWGGIGKCDLPERTFYNFIETLNSSIKPDFVIWLGDNSAHNVWNEKKETHLNASFLVADKLKEYYPNRGQVYPVVGNHEGFPCDIFELPTHQWVLDELADSWKQWLTNDSYISLKTAGRYSQLHPGTSLRMISFLSFPYDPLNPDYFKNMTNPMGLLDWLEETLDYSEKHNESVLMLGHIPPNDRATLEWSFRYSVLVERYSHIIKGQFFGHTHKDTFSINHGESETSYTGVMQILPSLTTFSYLNPSFRLYEMEKSSFELIDYEQWRLYIEEANESDKPVWRIAYSFQEYYNVTSLKPEAFASIALKFKNDKEFFKKVVTMKYSEGPNAEKHFDDQKKEFCYYYYGTFEDIFKCLRLKKNGYYILAKYFLPRWQWAIFENTTEADFNELDEF